MERQTNLIKWEFWRKFKKDKLAVAGLIFMGLLILIALLGSAIRPDRSENANHQNLSIAKKGPLTRIDFHDNDDVCLKTDCSETHHQKIYILGTDRMGRDVLSRLMAGTQISLMVGMIAVVISLLVGITIGLVAGYYRGWVDGVLSWMINVIWSIPSLLIVMAFILAFGTGFWKVFLAIGLTMWVEVARIVRGQVLSIREKEYIEAAKAIGISDIKILFQQILPNIWPAIIVVSSANFSSAILVESGMSFLGLGVQIPTPSWGNMIRENYALLPTNQAYLALAPGICIMITVLALMYIGNGLRSAFDPKTEG
jgi:peptide/nickel transport system permease protein